mmetsp:Transcript_13980/g.28346  ORF Transcript_13980/g.28346 Transcript_13980/m.28346 type:complete len:213 (-) Transcript_13980:389-1027(-)
MKSEYRGWSCGRMIRQCCVKVQHRLKVSWSSRGVDPNEVDELNAFLLRLAPGRVRDAGVRQELDKAGALEHGLLPSGLLVQVELLLCLLVLVVRVELRLEQVHALQLVRGNQEHAIGRGTESGLVIPRHQLFDVILPKLLDEYVHERRLRITLVNPREPVDEVVACLHTTLRLRPRGALAEHKVVAAPLLEVAESLAERCILDARTPEGTRA